jgi:hypothetical protein
MSEPTTMPMRRGGAPERGRPRPSAPGTLRSLAEGGLVIDRLFREGPGFLDCGLS